MKSYFYHKNDLDLDKRTGTGTEHMLQDEKLFIFLQQEWKT